MKSNKQKSRIILGLMLIIGLFSLHNIGYLGNANSNSYEQNMIIDDLKTSGTYKNITIDNLPGSSNNWAWAESQVWCSGSGTLLDPYIIEGHILNMSRSIDGLKITNSHNKHFIIRNCTFKWDGVTNSILMTGISLLNTTHGRIEDNLIYHLGYGILLENCENINVTGNTLYEHTYGIKLEDSDFNNIIGNTASNNSLGSPLGIYLYFSDNNTVLGNMANNNDNGIYLEESDDNTISGNTANGNSQNGIYSYFCDYNNITGNTVDNNYDGIKLDTSCDNNFIEGNTANDNNRAGIYLADSDYNNITGNTASGSIDGIFLEDQNDNNIITGNFFNNNDAGIEIYYSDFNTIVENIANNNDNYGMRVEGSINNTITRNTIKNNTIYGMYVQTDSNNNTISENFFLDNGEHAYDDGTDNKWNSATIGNYWDNHTGPDTSPPYGIVDTQYKISGSAGGIDYLPIAEDGAPSILINSPDPGDTFGSTAPSFNVRIIDDYLDEMWYSIDGGLNNYTFTDNGTIDQSAWDAISEGPITITFFANDTLGHEASDEVIITKSIPPAGDDPTIIIVIVVVSIVGGVVVLAVVYLFMKKRGTS